LKGVLRDYTIELAMLPSYFSTLMCRFALCPKAVDNELRHCSPVGSVSLLMLYSSWNVHDIVGGVVTVTEK